MNGLEGLMRRETAIWHACSETQAPRLRRRYTPGEQAQREAAAERFLAVLESANGDGRQHVVHSFGAFAREALDLSEPQLSLISEDGLPKVARDLAKEARRFDPEVTAEDVFQASRNVCTAGGLQVLLGCPLELTPALFSYSMLYPYTDNLLDDPAVPTEEKQTFNRRFRSRLLGERVLPANDRERKAWLLVERIENQYNRAKFPGVYGSLLAIQEAQEESVGLKLAARLSPAEVLQGVFAKGGSSVLADGYLAAGRLTTSQAEFAFGWGVLLQLGDDLQDVAEDMAGGTATLFSESAERCPLDGLTNRVFAFGNRVFSRLSSFHAPGAGPLKQLIRRSASTLLITAAGAAQRMYTSGYVRALEQHSPFRFAFVRENRKRFFAAGGIWGDLMPRTGGYAG